MKTQAELTELLDFIGEYATYLLGSGVHTSRVVRNARRIGASQSVDVRLTTFQRTSILTVREEGNPQRPEERRVGKECRTPSSP